MNIKEFYENKEKVLGIVFKDLQADTQRLVPELGAPEVLEDDLLNEWLALNYMWAIDFKADGNLMMGEIGGIIPTHPQNGKKVLAIAEASMDKVLLGFGEIKEAEREDNERIIVELETEIEMPLEYREGITVVNGNRNIAHYDFSSGVARNNPLDLLTTNEYLLFGAEGIGTLSNKCLNGEQYILNVPVNKKLFEKLKTVAEDEDFEKKLDILKSSKQTILPNQFIAGFHIIYREKKITLIPIISEKEKDTHSKYLRKEGLEALPSDIVYMGGSDPHGEFGVMEEKLLE